MSRNLIREKEEVVVSGWEVGGYGLKGRWEKSEKKSRNIESTDNSALLYGGIAVGNFSNSSV